MHTFKCTREKSLAHPRPIKDKSYKELNHWEAINHDQDISFPIFTKPFSKQYKVERTDECRNPRVLIAVRFQNLAHDDDVKQADSCDVLDDGIAAS